MQSRRTSGLPCALVLAVALCPGPAAISAAQSKPIQIENAKPGSTGWLLTKVVRHDDEIDEMGWNIVLSTPPGFQNPPRKDFRRSDPRIQRITKNILDRMIGTKISTD